MRLEPIDNKQALIYGLPDARKTNVSAIVLYDRDGFTHVFIHAQVVKEGDDRVVGYCWLEQRHDP